MGDMARCPRCQTHHYTNDPCPHEPEPEYVPFVRWFKETDPTGTRTVWNLKVGRGKHPRIAASVYDNGVWHTFDINGAGGENSVEETVSKARIEAAASAIAQRFI